MKILITGARGMVGTALTANLYNLKEGKNKTRPNLFIEEIYEYDLGSTPEELDAYCKKADFVFHLAGVNRPKEISEFREGNFGFSSHLLASLKQANNTAAVMLASSIQAALSGRFADSEYGKSKRAGEELFFQYERETGAKVAIYRFPNLMGHSRPNYNSAVSTFCYSIANDLPYTVNDRNTELELLYIDDLVEGMLDLLEGREKYCEYPDAEGKYCYIPLTYHVTLGKIVDLLEEFKSQPKTLWMPKMPEGSFEKKLYSLYLTYLPKEKFIFDLKMNQDARGSFTEVLKTKDYGQFSVNISKPGVTKGEHWHNSKWEFFVVVSGRGLVQERKLGTEEIVEFEVSGDKLQAVYMIPGWTHRLVNLSDTKELVTLMWANEVFDEKRPDTFREMVRF